MQMRRRVLVPVLGLVLSSASGAPVQIAQAVAAPLCAEPGTSPLARGGEGPQRERDFRSITPDSDIPSGEQPATSPSFTATVPVWFHVIAASTSPRDGWVSDRQLADQLAVLNGAFAGTYGGHRTGFHFTHAGTTRTINADWFAMETFESEMAAKTALRRGDATTLNMYINSGGGYLGWAYYPKIVAGEPYQVLDGAVVHFDSLPGGKIRNYNLGHTASHEVGHWLGLAHTFEGGCKGHGDHVDDTPAQAYPTSGCPVGKDSCSSPGVDPIHNFMDYSYDSCYSEFTAGQSARAQAQWLHWRVKHGY
jgi:hypothetical protein